MGCKRLVAPQLEVPHHFIKGIARGRARRVEHPGAFGAAPTPKTVFFDPNEISGPDVLYHFLVRFLVRFSLNTPASVSALKWPSTGIGATCCFDTPTKQIERPESVGSTVYLWGQARTNGRIGNFLGHPSEVE